MLVLDNPFWWFFPRPQLASSHACILMRALLIFEEDLQISRVFSPSSFLLSGTASCDLPRFSELFLQVRESARLHLASHSLCHSLDTLQRQYNGGNSRPHPIILEQTLVQKNQRPRNKPYNLSQLLKVTLTLIFCNSEEGFTFPSVIQSYI